MILLSGSPTENCSQESSCQGDPRHARSELLTKAPMLVVTAVPYRLLALAGNHSRILKRSSDDTGVLFFLRTWPQYLRLRMLAPNANLVNPVFLRPKLRGTIGASRMESEHLTTSQARPEDRALDATLRPRTLGDFIGQTTLRRALEIFLTAAKQRREPIEHVLLYGAPGLGKTTLAHVIAHELDVRLRITSGPAMERPGDLAAILTNLEDGDILFIDEIHRLHRIVEEMLYPAMEEFGLDIVLGKGPAARTVRLDLPRFTIIGATTRLSLLSSPLRGRFGMTYQLEFYTEGELTTILKRNAKLLRISATDAALQTIAERSRRTPRVANRLLKRVRDFAQVHGHRSITPDHADEALALLAIDRAGLDAQDRRLLETIIEKFSGGPVGLTTLAAATGEEAETIEIVYEPFLIQGGFLARTARGRIVTEHAYQHLGLPVPARQSSLLH